MYKTEELFDLEHTICKKYLQECEYPWEALPLIKKFIKELALLEPFGKENRKPVFAMKELRVLYPKIVGKNKNVVRMMLKEKNGFKIDAVYFGEPEPFMERLKSPEPITVTYYPEINVYNDSESIKVIVTDFR